MEMEFAAELCVEKREGMLRHAPKFFVFHRPDNEPATLSTRRTDFYSRSAADFFH